MTGEFKYRPVALPESINLSVEDIEIGAVELKNHDSDVRATIETKGSKTALAIEVLDALGNQISSFGADPVGLKNLASIQVNPATEDTLGTVVKKATTPTVYNVAMASADTEYSQALPSGTKKFLIKLRTDAVMKVKFASGGNYITVPSGGSYNEDNLDLTGVTLYFESSVASNTAEIIAWV